MNELMPAARKVVDIYMGVKRGESSRHMPHSLSDNSSFGGKVKAKAHIDGIIKKPTIQVDGKTFMVNGRLFWL